jgi:hypothetical protein
MPAAIEINPDSIVHRTFITQGQVSLDESAKQDGVESAKSLFRRSQLCVTISALLLQF